ETGESEGTQLDLECLGAAPSRIWALAGASRRPPHSFRSGLTASILISFKTSLACGMASLPAGNWFALRTYALISAFASRLKLPGLFCGLVLRVRSNRSPTLRVFQLARNAPPARGGDDSPPSSMSPWQEAQSSVERTWPRLA